MRVKLLALSYAPALCGFDDRPLAEFVRDKEVLAVRKHFFSVHLGGRFRRPGNAA